MDTRGIYETTDDTIIEHMRHMAVQNAIETVLNQQEYVTGKDAKIAILKSIIDNLEGEKTRVVS
jgi:hypothetical protein